MPLHSKINELLARTLAIQIRPVNAQTTPSLQTAAALGVMEIDVVLDVGANVGQFAQELRTANYKGHLVSFEPLSTAHRVLASRASRANGWTVHPRCAVGARIDQIEINVAANSVSSSALPMLNAHLAAAPGSSYVSHETVPMITVDSIWDQYCGTAQAPFLKIDTQGYEWQVLDGALESLPKCKGVLLELSLVPLYEEQRLWNDLIARMAQSGFELWSLQPGFVDKRTGRTLQLDGLFAQRAFILSQ